jgi:hypothetical protein
MTRLKTAGSLITGVVLFSALLALVDPAGASLRGWLAYAILSTVGALALGLTWLWLTGGTGPRWLLACVLVGLVMRAGVAVGLERGLPLFGYDEKVQKAGYVYFDAYKRDMDAWAISRTDQPLWQELTEPRASDQYGGMLLLSAAIYRTISSDAHRPLLISLLTGFVSTLGILFSWAFVVRTFGVKASTFAAWIVAIYPEGVLLSSSQMRDPFVMTSIAAAMLGYALYREGRVRAATATVLIAAACVLPISPPYALLTFAAPVLAAAWEGRVKWQRTWAVALPAIVLVALLIFFLVQAWMALRVGGAAPLDTLERWWEDVGAQWRLNLLEEQSEWISNLFNILPAWGQPLFVVFYGVVQPLLPAAIAYPGAAIWRAIAVWRSIGWYAILPFVLYAPIPAFRSGGRRSLQAYLVALFWLGAVVAAYRATLYQWDSPRYRAVLLTVQAATAAWAWVHAHEVRSPWLARSAGLLAIPTVALLAWYLGRYYGWVSLDLFAGMGASLLIDALLVLGWVIRRPGSDKLAVGGPP